MQHDIVEVKAHTRRHAALKQSKEEVAKLRHFRVYGGDGPSVVVQEHHNGAMVDESEFDSPEDAKRHLAEVIDEHYDVNTEQGEGE